MALMTVQRTSSVSDCESASAPTSESDSFEELQNEKLDKVPCLQSPAKSSKRLVRQGSVSENFFAVKGAALILPRQTSLATANLQIVKKFGGELHTHLHAIFHLLRPQDNIKLAVRLESWSDEHRRYLVIISTCGRQDTDESVIIGCDFPSHNSSACTIGLVLPIWNDTNIKLNGDGGFEVICNDKKHIFKPVSVQAMWSALQSLHRCVDVARRHNYYDGSLYLTWIGYYQSKIESRRIYLNEWEYNDELWSTRPNYFAEMDQDRLSIESLIKNRLKQVMMTLDLDNCTSKDVRTALEKTIDLDLTNYKKYIDSEMLMVLGQMDCPSKILDYLYLGSEWNACNFEELQELGITHILNVTLEVDNFFPDDFIYKNIRLYDIESSDLLPHWNNTWKFINEARKSSGKCLVHCKMGISRSGATVVAYLMKEMQWQKSESLEFVKECRSIVHPNPSFLRQLDEYGGILSASSQRHNKLFRSRSESSLSEPAGGEEQPTVTSPRSGAPVIQICDVNANSDVVTVEPCDFDLNRRLLDLASIHATKLSRPKSWSPDEGRRPYTKPEKLPGPLTPTERSPGVEGSHHLHVSEPGELLAPRTDDVDRRKKAEVKRKNFTELRANLRRHTANNPVDLQVDELALSEDSVFVHDGTSSRHFTSSIKPGSTHQKVRVRSSSPAAISCDKTESSLLPDAAVAEERTPTASPLKNPPNKNAATVDVDKLKLCFSDQNFAQLVASEERDPVMSQSSCKSSVPVKAIVAVIESPTTDVNQSVAGASFKTQAGASSDKSSYVKGHHKASSLTPADVSALQSQQAPSETEANRTSRSRSLSETQAFSVRKIVTAIESRNSPDLKTEEAKSSHDADGLHRSMSMPSSRRKVVSPVTNAASSSCFMPVAETVVEAECESDPASGPTTSNVSQFYIDGDLLSKPLELSANANGNNNLASPTLPETLVITPGIPQEQPRKLVQDLRLNAGEHQQVCDQQPPGPFSPEMLQVIREVGLQLMSDSEESSLSSVSMSRRESSNLTSPETPRDSSGPHKKRGIVRQMAREIEKRIRKLAGKSPKTHKAPANISSPPVTPVARKSSPTTMINSLLMGSAAFQQGGDAGSQLYLAPEKLKRMESPATLENSADFRVRDLVDKFDCSEGASLCSSKSLSNASTFYPDATHREREAIGLVTLVTATPYRTPCSRCNLSSSPRVRRSQSERAAHRSSPRRAAHSSEVTDGSGLFCAKSHPDLGASCGDASFSRRARATRVSPCSTLPGSTELHDVPSASRSPQAVREIVRSIEANRSSSAVQRSASMPSNSCRSKWKATDKNSPPVRTRHFRKQRRILFRSRSTPLLDTIRGGGFSPA